MKNTKFVFILASLFILTSCYHAQITTDKNPSSTVIENQWAHSFIFGLVPPKVVETAEECPNGLSKVETKISFLNGLVSGITFNLYTPMTITVTCAAGAGASVIDSAPDKKITVKSGANAKEKENAFREASQKAKDSGEAVYVAFD